MKQLGQVFDNFKDTNLNVSSLFNGGNNLDLICQLQVANRRYHHVHLLNRLYQTSMVIQISLEKQKQEKGPH